MTDRVSIRRIHPLVRHAGNVTLVRGDRERTRVAYDHRVFIASVPGAEITAGYLSLALGAGEAVVIPAGTPYRIGPAKGEESSRIVSINFDFFGGPGEENAPTALPLATPESFDPESLRERVNFEEGFLSEGAELSRVTEEASPLLDAILREFSFGEICYTASISGLLTAFLCLLYRAAREPARAGVRREILSHIAAHFSEPLSAHSLAGQFHYHPNYISAVVKEQTGLPLHQYVLRLRVRRASELLLYTDLPVEEVGRQAGFEDPAYFSQYFRRATGFLPTALRSQRAPKERL
ncbi:MAG: helix-turn-helix domain-containing protein [Clostridia bacterium]|nr:helix-turn-helix domain-containing protein [Clostridia bacterium]